MLRNMSRSRNRTFSWVLDFTEIVTHIWGIITVIVLWGVGTDLIVHEHNIGGYILFLAAVLSIFETSFAVNIFMEFYIKDERHACFQCCQTLQWLDLWKKTAFYLLAAFFCFLKPAKLWLATVGGTMLIILAFLYLVLSYKVHLTTQDALFFDKENSYDRFDDLQEEIDDSLPEPSGENVGDQNSILQV